MLKNERQAEVISGKYLLDISNKPLVRVLPVLQGSRPAGPFVFPSNGDGNARG